MYGHTSTILGTPAHFQAVLHDMYCQTGSFWASECNCGLNDEFFATFVSRNCTQIWSAPWILGLILHTSTISG
jgi:hypothetical protein